MPVDGKRTLRFGPFQLDIECGQVRKDGVGLKLQGQPVQILELLLVRAGELITREEIRQRLWASDTFVDFDHSLNTAIKKLRHALEDDPDHPRYIETVPKHGYRFIGEVEHEEARVTNSPAPTIPLEVNPGTQSHNNLYSRNRQFAVAAIVLVASLAIGTGAYLALRPPPVPRIATSLALTRTDVVKTRFSWISTDGRSLYFHEGRTPATSIMQVPVRGGTPTQVQSPAGSLLGDISKDGVELLLRTFDEEAKRSDIWVQPVAGGPARLAVKDAHWAAWTADYSGILFSRNNDRELYRVNADGTDLRLLAKFPDITFLRMSPDRRRIRVINAYAGAFWDADSDGSNPHPVPMAHSGSILPGDWSPDGKFYFFISRDERDSRWDIWVVPEKRHWWQRTPHSTQLTFGPLSFYIPTVSKDGKYLYSVGHERRGELSAYDRKSRQLVPYPSGISACYVDFSRDGQWVAYVSYPDGALWRSRIDGTERRQLTVSPMGAMNPRWSPDGKLIVFTQVSQGTAMGSIRSAVYVVSLDGGTPLLLIGNGENPADPTWSPDGNSIAYAAQGSAGSEIRILDLQSQKSSKVPGSDRMGSPRWSPDGNYLVAVASKSGFNSTTVLFSFSSQQWEELIPQVCDWPSWSSDSKYVYAQVGDKLVRITISDRKVEQIASVQGFATTSYFLDRWRVGWWGFTPDGTPLTTRDIGTDEIYAFELQYP